MIAGLGNPGEAYANTAHNVGFDVVDELARRLDADWKGSFWFKARTARATLGGQQLMLVKPQTYMNLSGTSVAPLLRYFGGTPADLTVVSDDADLPLGRLRIRGGGGSGGHRGLASVIGALGTEAFARIRVGVGREGDRRRDLAGQVLAKLDEARRTVLDKAAGAAADAVTCLIEKGLNETMNRFNGWGAAEAAPADGEAGE
ncbi:MAG: aminoacyl-tRNA hydrolase [Kiritimatiellaeota bacterium]|nr:aminoacyl-tRNA hydrolase [Kiritimatiellota bacterium]